MAASEFRRLSGRAGHTTDSNGSFREDRHNSFDEQIGNKSITPSIGVDTIEQKLLHALPLEGRIDVD